MLLAMDFQKRSAHGRLYFSYVRKTEHVYTKHRDVLKLKHSGGVFCVPPMSTPFEMCPNVTVGSKRLKWNKILQLKSKYQKDWCRQWRKCTTDMSAANLRSSQLAQTSRTIARDRRQLQYAPAKSVGRVAQSVWRPTRGWRVRGRIPVVTRFSARPRPALGSTQPPVKWVPGLSRR